MKRVMVFWGMVGIIGTAATASAHEFVCEKRVNGQTDIVVSTYPTTLHYTFKVINIHPFDTSIAQSVVDGFLASFGYTFTRATPFAVPVGGSVSDSFDLTIHSYQQCLDYAARTPGGATSTILNTLVVTWEGGGYTTCSAKVQCKPPVVTSKTTRTMGFFRNHVDALDQCLDQGPIDLGFITISSTNQALGLLEGSPSSFGDGTDRTGLDKYRFLLGRQTLVGICNQRLFGSAPSDPLLLVKAVAALRGTNCALISSLIGPVDAYNNSGDALPFPSGFDPGAVTPQTTAADPTTPSGQTCQ